MLETTSCAPSLNLAPITDYQSNLGCGYNQVTSFPSSTSPHNRSINANSLLNLLQFSHEKDSIDPTVTENSSRNDHHDEYGFIWDMTFHEDNMENEVASHLDEMRFEMDDNTTVFL